MSLSPLNPMEEPEPLLEINTTPLIDVMLVLLIMFIITIPVQLHAVNLQTAPPVAAHLAEKPTTIQIEIQMDNSVWWDGQALMNKADLEKRLAMLQAGAATQQQQPEMHIKAHPRCKYGTVAMVLAGVQRYGFAKINIVQSKES